MWTLVLDGHSNVLSIGRQSGKAKPKSIRAKLVDDINRINSVAFTLAHCLTLTIKDLWVNEDFTEWDFANVVETNLISAFNMTKPCVRPMLKQKFGRIIMMGSVVGSMGNAGQANYAASKAGMVGFAKSMAKELGAKGITVNVVAPGFIDTDMTKALPESTLQTIIEGVPARRLGHVDDVAGVVSFLIDASYVTGQVIHVDGGMVM